MTDGKKEIKIEFAPGCFDSFEGTQEELEELMKQIQEVFQNSTQEELLAMGREMTEEDFAELPPDAQYQLARTLPGMEEEFETFQRKLQ